MRFVIADDSDIPRNILLRILTQAGHEVVRACDDGDEAIAACNELRPDVAVLDMSMKRVSGRIAAIEIKNKGTAGHVVMASSMAQGATSRPLLDMGIAFIAKPYNSAKFLTDLNRALGIPD